MSNYFKIYFALVLINNLWPCVMPLYVQNLRYLDTKDSANLVPESYSERTFVRVKKHNIRVGSCAKGMEWYFGKCRPKKRKEDDYYDEILPKTNIIPYNNGVLKDTFYMVKTSTLSDILFITEASRQIEKETSSQHEILSTKDTTSNIVEKTSLDKILPTTESTSTIEQTSVLEPFKNNTLIEHIHKWNSTTCDSEYNDSDISLMMYCIILLLMLAVVICWTRCVTR